MLAYHYDKFNKINVCTTNKVEKKAKKIIFFQKINELILLKAFLDKENTL